MQIHVLNPIWAIARTDVDFLKEKFKYPCEKWIRIGNHKERHVYYRSMVGSSGYFFTGLIPLLSQYTPTVTGAYFYEYPSFDVPERLGSFILEDYQRATIKIALKEGRGVLQAPTGSGKTLIEATILSILQIPALFLVRSKDLMYQSHEVLEGVLQEPIGMIGDKKKFLVAYNYWYDSKSL